MGTYLDQILNFHREEAVNDPRPLDGLLDLARSVDKPRDFVTPLVESSLEELSLITEIKRRSPLKGDLEIDLNPADLANEYTEGGARCLSVLTDNNFFHGSLSDLRVARSFTELPVLRKDFTVDVRDVCDARIAGADAVLLIVVALDDHELLDFYSLATELSMAVLVEVHNEKDVERALSIDAEVIGVNQRDLSTFEIDSNRASYLAKFIPEEKVRIAESGIKTKFDALKILQAGYDAALVGEALVTSNNRFSTMQDLRFPFKGSNIRERE